MGTLNGKLRASTLIEVIVAMLIILASFGLALSVIDSNRKSMNTKLLTKAHQCVLSEKNRTLFEKRFFDETIEYGTIRIVKTVEGYPASPKLKKLEIQAINIDEKVLTSLHEIIIVE